MDLKKRKFIARFIPLSISLICFVLSIWYPLLRYAGTFSLSISALFVIPLISILKDKEYLQKYDERDVYIEQKSHTVVSLATFSAEIIALIVFGFLNMKTYIDIIIHIYVAQLILYFISWLIFRKRY